jgi:23S rRNA (pseudouridine1915-N3)-methyltransferase
MGIKITLAVIGRLKEAYLAQAEAEYVKRLRPYCTLSIVEYKDEAAVVEAIPSSALVYAFDERGSSMTSNAFARDVIGAAELHGAGAPIWFLIGGADGHSDEMRKRARKLLSFGQFTIAHRLVRLLVVEQIYRGFRILRGEPYHRE